VTYTVEERPNDPPTATITGPEEDGVYFVGQQVPAAYTCADPDGAIASCVGDGPVGEPIDTATVGSKTFTVTATDDAGATTTVSQPYRVVAVDGLCKGLAVGVLGIDLGGANGQETPCATRSSTVVDAYVGIGPSLPPLLKALSAGVRAQAVLGTTVSGPGTASATASVAKATIGIPAAGLALEVHGVHTSAASRLSSCAAPAALTSSSRIQKVTLNGKPILVGEGAPITIPLIIGALHLNQRIEAGGTVIRRAVFLDLPGTALDVVIAESKAGASCAP
jgi:hypothetical protein